MSGRRAFLLLAGITLLSFLAGLQPAAAAEPTVPNASETSRLWIASPASNNLVQGLIGAGHQIHRFDSAAEVIAAAPPGSAVLILADRYPEQTTDIDAATLQQARQKKLRLFLEYPSAVPGIEFGPPRGVEWERCIIASQDPATGLPLKQILSLQDCRFLPVAPRPSLLVMGRVAGFDTAVYGIPENASPLLFRLEDGTLIATTGLSHFVTGRFAPTAEWVTLWQSLLDSLNPAGAPHRLKITPTVRPSYSKDEPLPAAIELESLIRAAGFFRNSGLLISAERRPEIEKLLLGGSETTPATSAPSGDGSHGILEGYASRILPDGTQPQRTPIRADCQAESAAVLAMHAALTSDAQSRQIATNLLNSLYFTSEQHQGVRGNPRHPAFGLVAWGEIHPAWQVANYGDDNARVLLASIVAAAALQSDAWDEAILKALYANLRTTGKRGFRGDRVDIPRLEQEGLKAIQNAETVNVSPFFEAYLWACYLWAYHHTGDPAFLDVAKPGIRTCMEQYPAGWRWGNHLDRSHMLLALAWLIRVEDTPEHRGWLQRVMADQIKNQQPCGAIPEMIGSNAVGHYLVPASNEAYGTTETPLLQQDGDPVSDQLYTTGFVLLALHEAVGVINEPAWRQAEDRLATYVTRIQTRSPDLPALDGTWFRAFDFNRWDYWSSSGDMGWGAWCAEAGWGPAWNAIVLGLRQKNQTLWDYSAGSAIKKRQARVLELMSQNDGLPYVNPEPAR